MRDQDEESNCHVYENKGVVQLAVVPDELVGVPAFALLDHAVFWGVVHEGLGAWIENAERLSGEEQGFENEVRISSWNVNDAFLKWRVLRPTKVNSLAIPRLSNPLPRYFLVIHYPKLNYDRHIKALKQHISIIKVLNRSNLHQLLNRTNQLNLARIRRVCSWLQAPVPLSVQMHFLSLGAEVKEPL